MNQPMAIDELVSVAQAEAMGELDAPMMAIVLSIATLRHAERSRWREMAGEVPGTGRSPRRGEPHGV